MSGGFVRNTVPGRKRGKKWPPEIRFACECEMVVGKDIHGIAQKYGPPESTLRTWWKALVAKGLGAHSELMQEAQRQALQGIAYDAATAARLNLEMINLRLARADRNAERAEEIDAMLLDRENPPDEEQRAQLQREKELRPPLGDYPLANYARVLMGVREKATEGSVVHKADAETAVNISEADRRLLEKVGRRMAGDSGEGV